MITWGTISLPVKGLKRAQSALRGPRGPLAQALRPWTTAYSAFVLNRFNVFSRGGGDWPRLKPSTIKAKGSSAILVDRAQLKAGLQSALGLTMQTGSRAVITFIKGRKHRSGLDIGRLATIHHLGLGVVPARRILAKPDRMTTQRMAVIVADIMRKLIRGSIH